MSHHVPGQGPKGASGGPALRFVGANRNIVAGTCPWPAGVQAGDLAIFCPTLFDGAGAGVPSRATPAGWTVVANSSGGQDYGGDSVASAVYIKGPLTAGDIASPIPTVNASMARTGTVLVFRSDGPFTSWDGIGFQQETNGGVPANQTVTAAGQTVPCVVIGFGGKRYTGGNTLSFSPAPDGTDIASNANQLQTVAWKIYNAAPQNHIVGYDIDRLVSGLVRITGAS